MKKSIFVLIVFLFSGLMIFAQPPKGMKRGGNGMGSSVMPIERIIPDLTEEQSEKFKDLRIAMLRETQPILNKMRELRAAYHTEITSENPDMEAIEKNINERTALQAEMMKSHARHHLAVANILTEDQRVIFNNSGQGCRRMKAGPGKGEGPGPRI